MPRVDIPVTVIDRTTSDQPSQTSSNATDDHVVEGGADGLTFLEIENTGGSPATVVVVRNPTLAGPDDLTISDLTITIPNGDTVVRGGFRTSSYRQNAQNDLWINPSVSTDLKIRAYRLPTPS